MKIPSIRRIVLFAESLVRDLVHFAVSNVRQFALFAICVVMGLIIYHGLEFLVPDPVVRSGVGEIYFLSEEGRAITVRDENVAPIGTIVVDSVNNNIYIACYRSLVVFENVIILETEDTDVVITLNGLCNDQFGTAFAESTPWSELFPSE